MPVVVSEWELSHGPTGASRLAPAPSPSPGAVTVKDDDAPARERVRRFVEAWRWLVAARSQIQSAGLSADESDRYLAGAGVLVRVVPPSANRRRAASVVPPPLQVLGSGWDVRGRSEPGA